MKSKISRWEGESDGADRLLTTRCYHTETDIVGRVWDIRGRRMSSRSSSPLEVVPSGLAQSICRNDTNSEAVFPVFLWNGRHHEWYTTTALFSTDTLLFLRQQNLEKQKTRWLIISFFLVCVCVCVYMAMAFCLIYLDSLKDSRTDVKYRSFFPLNPSRRQPLSITGFWNGVSRKKISRRPSLIAMMMETSHLGTLVSGWIS